VTNRLRLRYFAIGLLGALIASIPNTAVFTVVLAGGSAAYLFFAYWRSRHVQ